VEVRQFAGLPRKPESDVLMDSSDQTIIEEEEEEEEKAFRIDREVSCEGAHPF